MRKVLENYIFDLDGTLVNSSEEILKCLKLSFQEALCSFDNSEIGPEIIGPPINEIIRIIEPNISDDKLRIIVTNFRKNYDLDENDQSYLYEGVLKVLQELKDNKKRLFIATFKPYVPTQRLLKMLKLNMFEAVYTIDSPNKYCSKTEMVKYLVSDFNLNREKTIMIGDACSDIIAAKENNIMSVGVLWGYGSNNQDLIKNADIIIHKIEDLECLK